MVVAVPPASRTTHLRFYFRSKFTTGTTVPKMVYFEKEKEEKRKKKKEWKEKEREEKAKPTVRYIFCIILNSAI